MKGNCLIAQSGGPSSAINASLCGAYLEMSASPDVGTVYGGIHGIQGILGEKLLELPPILNQGHNVRILAQTPSASLGSCRFKLKSPEERPEEYAQIFSVFEKYDIRYFIYIGGNDSMDTVYRLSKYAESVGRDMRIMGIPKTIDNDLVGTDHTPGFGSCAKYIATTIKEAAQDNIVYDMDSVFIVEAMGRDAGWIALSAALARDAENRPQCDLIYTPETPFSTEKFLADVNTVREKKGQLVVVVSEGVKDENGIYLSDTGETDAFGHKMLRGAGAVVAEIIRKNLGVKVRDSELSILQRCAAHCASATDLSESESLGRLSAKGALEGLSGKMSCIRRISDAPYQIEYSYTDVSDVANAVKTVPGEFFNPARNHASEKGIRYLLPLIEGTRDPLLENGLPVYLNLASLYKNA